MGRTYVNTMSIIVTLLVVGSLLLLAEIFTPGMIAGTIGAICFLFAIMAAYREYDAPDSHYLAIGIILLAGIEFIAWLRFFPDSKLAERFVSKGSIGTLGNERPELVGQKGVAVTDLRPSGAVRLDSGGKIDVVSEGNLIECDTRVGVIDVEGLRVVVRQED